VSNQPKSPHEEFIVFFLVLFIVGGIGWAVWTVYHNELVSALRWVRYGEMWLGSLLVGEEYSIVYKGQPYTLEKWLKIAPEADPREFKLSHMIIMSHLALKPVKWIFVGLISFMAVWVLISGPGTKYRRKMGLEGLIEEQAKTFPVIQPFVKFNPTKMQNRAPGDPVPKTLPLFAEALAPEEWVAHNRIQLVGGKLDFPKAYEALAKQLGPRWQGPEKLPLHARGLFAAFALKHIRKRTQCEDLLSQMAACWTHTSGFKPTLSLRKKINGYIKDPKIGGKLKKHCKKHAFQTTAMLRALQRARNEGGVIAPAQFVWLRGHDRALWYPLNNLGRKSYHAEASGAMAHYINEIIADQKIPTPKFDDVINVFEDVLTGPAARRIPKISE